MSTEAHRDQPSVFLWQSLGRLDDQRALGRNSCLPLQRDRLPKQFLIVRELESCEKRIAAFKDRESKTEPRRVRKLIEKLYQVRWSP